MFLPNEIDLSEDDFLRTTSLGYGYVRSSLFGRYRGRYAQAPTYQSSSGTMLWDLIRNRDSGLLEHVSKSITNRVLFWTSSGYLGLGNRYLKAGDAVVIFDGAQTPFVLRSAAVVDGDLEWTLVGDCYMDGWMDGTYNGNIVHHEEVHDAAGSIRSTKKTKNNGFDWLAVRRSLGLTPPLPKHRLLVKKDFVLR